jgi:hypothetical protein
MTLASRVAAEIIAFQPDAVFIDAGRGEGVIDRLRSLGFTVIEVNFGGKPTNEMYANKRSEMWDGMAKWLKAGGVIPNHGELKTDLATPTYAFNAANKLVLEPKDDIKKRGLRSTDIADALALTFAAPVMPKSRSFAVGFAPDHPRSNVAEYDRWLQARTPRLAATDNYDPVAEIAADFDPFAERACG